jgi:hypothetical protein
MRTEMRHVVAFMCAFLAGCTTVKDEFRMSPNIHIRFIQRVNNGDELFSEEELSRWHFPAERASMPEAADIKNLDHMQRLLAANPQRYESYACYGRCLVTRNLPKQQPPTEEEAEAAIYAFEKAEAIVEQEGIDPTLNYSSFYCSALYMKYGYERTRDDARPESVRWFDRILEVDPEYIKQHPHRDIGSTVLLAILDHVELNNTERAQELIVYAKELKQLTDDQRQTLSAIEQRMKKDPTQF